MTPEPLHSRLTTRPWIPFVPSMLVLLAAAAGIAGWMTKPKKQPRLDILHSDEALADIEKEEALMKRAVKEFPFVIVDLLRRSERHPMEGQALRTLGVYSPYYSVLWNNLKSDFLSYRPFTISTKNRLLSFRSNASTFPEEAPVFHELAFRLHTGVKTLRERFYAFASRENHLMGLLSFGESIALANAEEALKSVPPQPSESIRSFEAAAALVIHDAKARWRGAPDVHSFEPNYEPHALQRATLHLRKAEALTDWRQRPREWARIQGHLADCTALLGFGREAAEILREAITAVGRHPGSEPPDPPRPLSRISVVGRSVTLDSEPPDPGWMLRAQLETVLADRAPYAAAEAGIRSRLNRNTGLAMSSSSFFWLGEVEDRKVLANALFSQALYAQAEVWFRRFLPIHEHPIESGGRDELVGCTGLADVLEAQGKHDEAEQHYRKILEDCTRIRGPEHNDTLRTARELARCLQAQGKNAEALEFARRAADGWQKTLGAEHPRTVLAQELVKATTMALPPPRFR